MKRVKKFLQFLFSPQIEFVKGDLRYLRFEFSHFIGLFAGFLGGLNYDTDLGHWMSFTLCGVLFGLQIASISYCCRVEAESKACEESLAESPAN